MGHNVRRLRQAKGLTQAQVAHDAGINLTYLGGIERGRRNPSLMVMVGIATALEADPADFPAKPPPASR